jgi:hypothetical protein
MQNPEMKIENENNLRKNEPSSIGIEIIRNSTVEPIAENMYEQESNFDRKQVSKTKRLQQGEKVGLRAPTL